MIKAFAIDLDGTLLDSNFNISNKNINAIKKAIFLNYKIIIATGRSYESAINVINGKFDNFIENITFILQNGAVIFENINKKPIVNHIDKNDLKILFDEFDKYNFFFFIFDNFFKSKTIFIKNKRSVSVLNSYFEEKKNYLKEIDKNIFNYDVLEIATIDKKDRIFEFYNHLKTLDVYKNIRATNTKATYSKENDYWIEVLNQKAEKSEALKTVAKILNIKTSEICAIGDNLNDLLMLKLSGFPIAMKNGLLEIKSISKYITSSNNDNGVAHAILKIISEKI